MSEVNFLFPARQKTFEFGHKFVHSDAFKAIFDEGMSLVEDAASYLDGAGRHESATLPSEVTSIYIKESLRLTTRLMQIASWLLLQRAWAEGDLSSEQLVREKNRLSMTIKGIDTPMDDFEKLPERLRELVGLALRLHARILHLELLLADYSPVLTELENPVTAQLNILKKAFDPGHFEAS